MQITFKLYATLVKYLPPGTVGHAVVMDVEDTVTVQALINQYQISDKQAYLVMLNGVYIAPESRAEKVLQENDVLAVWPKVAGG